MKPSHGHRRLRPRGEEPAPGCRNPLISLTKSASRAPSTTHRAPGAEGLVPRAWCRGPGATESHREPSTTHHAPGAEGRAPGAEGRAPGAGSRVPGPSSWYRAPGTEGRAPGTEGRAPGAAHHEPRYRRCVSCLGLRASPHPDSRCGQGKPRRITPPGQGSRYGGNASPRLVQLPGRRTRRRAR